jgi:drug/metabolite transporter (DMT)-like permease
MPPILYVLLGLLSIVWGGSFYFIKILVEPFGPWGVTFLRCFCGAIFLLIVLLIRRNTQGLSNPPWFKLVSIGLVNSAVPWTLIAYSETMLSSGLTSVLNASTPIWTMILGILFFRIQSSIYQWMGISLGFVGIVILMDIDLSTLNADDMLGVLAMMLTAICYGFAAHLSKKYLQQVSVYLIAFITLAASSLFAGLFMMFTRPPEISTIFELDYFAAIMGLGFFCSGLAYILYYTILQKGNAQFVTMVTYLVPPFAIGWGVLLLDEELSLSLIAGLAFILTGVYLSGRKKQPKIRPVPAKM